MIGQYSIMLIAIILALVNTSSVITQSRTKLMKRILERIKA